MTFQRSTNTASVKRTVDVHVQAVHPEFAYNARDNFAATLGEVWIVDQVAMYHLPNSEVYKIRVTVTAPECELFPDAPIIKKAMGVTGLPTDSVSIQS